MTMNTIPSIAFGCGAFALAYALIVAIRCRWAGAGGGFALAALLPSPAAGPSLGLYAVVATIAGLGSMALNQPGSWTGTGFAAGIAGFLVSEWISRRMVLAAVLRAAAGSDPEQRLGEVSRCAGAAGLAAAGLALAAVAGYFESARGAIGLDGALRGLQAFAVGGVVAGMLVRTGVGAERRGAVATIGSIPGLYELFTLALATGLSLARQSFAVDDRPWLEFPLLVGAIALVAALGGMVSVGRRPKSPVALLRAAVVTLVVAAAGLFYAVFRLQGDVGLLQAAGSGGLTGTLAVGLLLSGFLVLIFEYYSSARSAPVKAVAAAATAGHDADVLAGMGVGMRAPAVSVLAMGCGFGWVMYLSGAESGGQGMFNIALAVLAMLPMGAVTGCFLVLGDIAACTVVISGQAQEADAVEPLGRAGSLVRSFSRSYAVAYSMLLALLLLAVFARSFPVPVRLDASSPAVVMGLLAGGLLPYLLAGLAMSSPPASDGRSARWGFRRLVRAALLGLLPVLLPLGVGLLAGREALGGFVLACVVVGLFQSIGMSAAGESWTGARSYVEQGMFGGRLSPAHEAAVTGALVGASYRHVVAAVIVPLTGLVGMSATLVAPLLN